MNLSRIVITGVGLTAPNGNNLAEFRQALLTGKSGVELFETRHMGKVLAGVCKFEATRYQTRKELRIGTRAGSVSIYSSHEAVKDSGIAWDKVDKSRVGIYLGITEHGNVETENEIASLATFNNDTKFWSHYHNPRTVANNPAGEASLNLGVTGPAYTLGAACAAGNIGIIHAAQMLRLGEVDFALAGGVSESIRSFGIFAAFKSQGALAHHVDPTKASRPFDMARNGIVVSEGGCLFAMERLEDAVARGAKIYAEIAGYAINSDASDYVLPNPVRQAECIRLAIKNAGMTPDQIDILNTHATSTPLGDVQECQAVASAFEGHQLPHINNTKGFIGHAMGAAGSIELAGNLPSFDDLVVHPTINVDDLDPQCALSTLVLNQPKKVKRVDAILNNSFGMLGINSALIVKRYVA